MPNITEEKWIEMLEKKADGTYIAKYPKVKSKSGITFDEHLADYEQHTPYAIATGTNTYTATIQGITTLVEGMSIKIKFTNANTGASTLNINGLGAIPIKKSNGNDLSEGNIKAGQILHLVYTGSVFQLLGEGGEYGTAQPEHVLEGYTIGTEEGIKSGTMPNQGRKIITPSTTNIAIPQGYHDGTGYVEGSENLKPENIKKGVNIFGVTGDYEPVSLTSKSEYCKTSMSLQRSHSNYIFNLPSISGSPIPYEEGKAIIVTAKQTNTVNLRCYLERRKVEEIYSRHCYISIKDITANTVLHNEVVSFDVDATTRDYYLGNTQFIAGHQYEFRARGIQDVKYGGELIFVDFWGYYSCDVWIDCRNLLGHLKIF